MRRAIYRALPTPPYERSPFAIGVREAIGCGIQHGGTEPEAEVTRVNLDILGDIGWRLCGNLPGHDAVGFAEDCGAGNSGQRFAREQAQMIVGSLLEGFATHVAYDRVDRSRSRTTGKRASQRNNLAHLVGIQLSQ